jgi:hypothetical protein
LGRPPALTENEQKQAVELTLKGPRSLRQGLTAIAPKLGKPLRRDTLKRRRGAGDDGWTRLPRSLRSGRAAAEARAAHAERADLRAAALEPARKGELWSFAEAGFTLPPWVPYAWQEVGPPLARAATSGPRPNRLGFLNRRHAFQSFAFEGALATQTVLRWFPRFSPHLERPARVVIANAPLHTGDASAEQMARGQPRGLAVKFLPPYCPGLDLIEILWRKIKYEWLPLDA